jgi:hypothetical protein
MVTNVFRWKMSFVKSNIYIQTFRLFVNHGMPIGNLIDAFGT